MTAVGIALFIFAILFSIGLHEFGHFITAKLFGMKVHSFYIGFKPALWKTQRGETEYGIGALPIGGFVKIAGMNPFEDVPPEDRDRVFKAKKPWQRAIVLAAGSFTHFVLAFLIVAGILMTAGVPDPDRPSLSVADVGAGTPAAEAGLQQGDVIQRVDGRSVDRWREVVDLVRARPGETFPIVLRRDDRTVTVTVTAARNNDRGENVGFLGVAPELERARFGPLSALAQAGETIGRGITESISAIKTVFAPSSIARVARQVVGSEERRATDPTTVVGIGGQAGALAARGDFATLFFLIAAFNIFIGVANLAPLPPLDGGHLAVLGFEKVTRRDVDMRRLIPISAFVIAVLSALFLMLLYLDIVKPLPPLPG